MTVYHKPQHFRPVSHEAKPVRDCDPDLNITALFDEVDIPCSLSLERLLDAICSRAEELPYD